MDVISSVEHLSRVGLDHSPFWISHKQMESRGPKAFRFLNVWVHHGGFLEAIRAAWKLNFSCSPVYALLHKMRQVKVALRNWNKIVFGDIFAAVQWMEEEVRILEEEAGEDLDEGTLVKLNEAKARYMMALNTECDFWRQNARIKWLKEVDANSKFFHAAVRTKRLKMRITQIRDKNGEWVYNREEIVKQGVDFFQGLLTAELRIDDYHNQFQRSMLECIPRLVGEEDNELSHRIPCKEEVKKAIFSLDPESAAGPDGFSGLFFQHCWDIVGDDVVMATQDFFVGSSLPKNDSPQTFSDFRPISLCNFTYKIKVLALRLENILP